ncbi:MAG: hypothetical protein K6A28_05950 [Bacteroidales bacterium]|nr:hypothetical protein [Bacteroidales bacterium]
MMKRFVTLALLLCCFITNGMAQNENASLTSEEVANYEVEIHKMVNYLQETLNFIGDPTQSAQEKQIIFNQSYSKIFQDDQVQIEDDLDTQRSTTLSKDVQAYLKDIDFFFQYAQFTFNIQSIANLVKADGTPYFKVTMNRQLVAKTVTNDTINDIKNRFIEINLDKKNNDLKIASIYTTKINERQSLRYWWNSMPSAWKDYFGKDLKVNDSIPLKAVMQINEADYIYSYPVLTEIGGETIVTDWKEVVMKTGLDTLYKQLKSLSLLKSVDVSGIKTITTLDPLTELSDLTTLNISGTNTNDLTPLRNANKLQVLKLAETYIGDLTPLKYDIMIHELDVAATQVNDLSILSSLNRIEKLNISETYVSTLKDLEHCPNLRYLIAEGSKISNIQPVSKLEVLQALDISGTNVRDLSPIAGLKSLQSLKISKTPVSNLEALRDLENLKELYCSNTSVKDLSPLQGHRRLSKIYCDNTKIDAEKAGEFTKVNPFTLVIYDTSALVKWWNNLPIYWKAVFSQQVALEAEPTTEQLHAVINMTELDLSGSDYLQNLNPVSRLTNLVNLNISNTEVDRLDPLYGMTNIENINLENTHVKDLSPLSTMSSLKVLNINNTPIQDLTPLCKNTHLEIVWANNTGITQSMVNPLKENVPNVTVVFQTGALQVWWSIIDETWKEIFRQHVGSTSIEPSDLELQRIVDLRDINIEKENSVNSLEPIRSFRWLEKLSIVSQDVHDLRPLADKPYLSELLAQNNPIDDLSPLENDTLLTVLNIENTQVTDIAVVENLRHLRILNASGTGIKSLKPLSKLNELEELLVNNTNVKSISPIEDLPSLKLLKIYNTKVKNKSVTALQQKRFGLNIVYY